MKYSHSSLLYTFNTELMNELLFDIKISIKSHSKSTSSHLKMFETLFSVKYFFPPFFCGMEHSSYTICCCKGGYVELASFFKVSERERERERI